jgi:signal transduction histidine kinase
MPKSLFSPLVGNRMPSRQKLRIRPYARLLAMLGDQLIANERVALMELIKNSYDADADWTKVLFEGFDSEGTEAKASARIVIEDNGLGMTEQVIRNAWMNPATPHKRRSDSSERTTPVKGRIVQGEKGIGRFAALKLGKKVQIITRPPKCSFEYVVEFDFTTYDSEFTLRNGKPAQIFLEDVHATLEKRKPSHFVSRMVRVNGRKRKAGETGMRIEVSHLKTRWTKLKVEKVSDDALKLQSVFSQLFTHKAEPIAMRFEVGFAIDEQEINYRRHRLDQLKELMETTAVLKVEEGVFDGAKMEFRFTLNGKKENIAFDELRGEFGARQVFGAQGNEDKRYPTCGSFGFSFFVFDLKAEASSPYAIDSDGVKLIKPHRVYLYRDGIRVYPYGNEEDDWLGVDALRGTVSAGYFLSNDQVIGCVDISHEHNPKLRDKTSREGLVEEGDATTDFIAVLRMLLSHLRSGPFQQYRVRVERRRRERALQEGKAEKVFAELLGHLQKTGDTAASRLAENAARAVATERTVLERRVETTEDLASVGIAVETSSHDLMLMMGKTLDAIDTLISASTSDSVVNVVDWSDELHKIRGMLAFIEHRMRDIQSLFKSSKQRRRRIIVKDVFEKVRKIYQSSFQKLAIEIEVEELGPPLVAYGTDAVLMQLFINLFDNSLYWLQEVPKLQRRVKLLLDGDSGYLYFSDSGPGVRAEDRPYIFEAFYSGKGEEGRGLGLYIARQLLHRLGYEIDLARTKKNLLKGATFEVCFVTEDK